MGGMRRVGVTARRVLVSLNMRTNLSQVDFGVRTQDLHGSSLGKVLIERRFHATVVIDNISDGHYGLAGTEALMMGLPVVTFNSHATREALLELTDGTPHVFNSCDPSIKWR